jgi:hypothetical protein
MPVEEKNQIFYDMTPTLGDALAWIAPGGKMAMTYTDQEQGCK